METDKIKYGLRALVSLLYMGGFLFCINSTGEGLAELSEYDTVAVMPGVDVIAVVRHLMGCVMFVGLIFWNKED